MRPRHKTAENVIEALKSCPDFWASMRPRHKTAENLVLNFINPNRRTQLQ